MNDPLLYPDRIDQGPYVCPGCHAVGGERCAPDCIDARMAREREEDAALDDFEDDETAEREAANG